MGVKHLWEVLDSCKKTLPLHCLENKRVCVDLSCWIVQLHKVNQSHCPLKSKVYLQGLFHRLRALLALNCRLIFVSDGSIPAIKLSTYWRRLNCGVEAPHPETNSQKVASLRRNMGSEFSLMIKEAKFLALALGIPCLDGVEEAEAQCALLNSESFCDGCFTSDSDVFLFGARTVYRDICLGEGGHVVCYEMADIESKLGFGRNSLISLALLLGSDYSPGVRGMGPETACHIVKSIGDTLILQRIISEGLSFAKKKSSKKHISHEMNMNAENSHNPQDNSIQQVINAYLNPKCHPVDSTMVLRALAQHEFQRVKVQQLCFQFFEWPPEKTDDYVLPKIAERELRRFANLRIASSESGVELLDKLPVKCPVSGIVKRRKSQGREYFEVLWDDLDGITSSAVPADLIKSACPEKIVEFEKKAQVKKQNKNKSEKESKEPENKVCLAELEVRLQNLMLEIESRSSAAQSTSFPSSENKKVEGLVNMDGEVENRSHCSHREVESSSDCSRREEVIDLVTPQATKAVSRCMKAVDVISLSDSESDMSPEHDRRAQVLPCCQKERL